MDNFYWKVFNKTIESLVSEGRLGLEFLLIPILGLLYIITAFLILKGYKKWRLIIRSISLVLLGIVFLQCLCMTKDTILGIRELFSGKIFIAFTFLWYPLFVFVSTLFLGRGFYCSWICPLGFVQELAGKANLCQRSKRLSYTILILLLIGTGVIICLLPSSPVIKGAGAWLGWLTIIISIFALKYPHKENKFSRVKYLILIAWAMLAIIGYKVPGPWCLIGKANLVPPVIISFLSVVLVSAILPRAWCRFICPDGGLLQLLSRKKKGMIDAPYAMIAPKPV